MISDAVKAELEATAPVVQRISGKDRFETAVKLAKEFLPDDAKQVFVATGMDFPDALAGAVLAAKKQSGVLVVDGRAKQVAPPVPVQEFFKDRGFILATIFGGPTAVNKEIKEWFLDNLAQ